MPHQVAYPKSRPKWWSLWLIPILILIGIVNSGAEQPPPEQASFALIELPPEAFSAPPTLSDMSQPQGHPKLDAAMNSLAVASRTSPHEAGRLAQTLSLRLSEGRVHVQIVVQASGLGAVTQAIIQAGGEVSGVSHDHTLIQGWLPVHSLEAIAGLEDVHFIRRPAEAVPMEAPLSSGSTTEGLAVLNGPAWHAAGHTGAGVKVGIIDVGFQGYRALLGTDLPSTVTAKNFVDGQGDGQIDGTTPHGTSCAEIVHDVAPGAALYLAKVNTNLDLQEAVYWLKNTHHVDVISTSLGWYNLTPGDGTGEFADLVQDARNAGIFWATAASNDRESHWGGTYTDTNGNNIHEFDGKEINCFGPGGNQCDAIEAGYVFHVFLRWDDWTHIDQDYDLYLVKWNGTNWVPIASSTVRQGGGPGQTPTEDAIALTSGPATAYGISIQRFDSTRNVNLEIFAPKFVRLNTVLYARSLSNLADAPAAMTVAALDVNAPYPQEPYSSQGPTNGAGGAATGGFIKPDISAYANVSTEGYGTQGFNGTSAATPHVAGAAALVLDARPDYTPTQVQSTLEGRAIDMGSAGQDTVYGHGRLYLGAPLSATPPRVDGITPASGLNTGTVHITNLAGGYFQAGATVKLSKSGQPDIHAANVTVTSERQITCDLTLNGAATGQWDVVVTNPDGESGTLAGGFTVRDLSPVVIGITPNAALYTGLVHISDLVGTRFQPGATVKLSKSNHPDIQATHVTWMDATRLTCDLNLTGAANGSWDVVVTHPDGKTGSLANGFEITAPNTAPRITGVTPSTGPNAEAISLTIVGKNFGASGPNPTVKLTKLGQPDIVASGVTVVDPAIIHCTVNLRGVAAGLWNVVVINPNGEHWTLTNGFSVINHVYLPLVARCSPPIALQPIDNADGDGRYVVEWSWASCGAPVSYYELQVDDDPGFGSSTEIGIPDPGQTTFTAYTPTPATYYWRARGFVADQGWSQWSAAQSATVSNWFAYVWVENDTSDSLTVEMVGLDKRNFDVGTHYWLRTAPGRYTVKAWAHCGPGSWEWNLIAGENTLKFNCSSGTAPDARTHDAESSLSGSLDNTR